MNEKKDVVQLLEQLNYKIDKLIQILQNQSKNQFPAVVLKCPCVGQLPVEDLVEMYAVRVQRMTRQAKSRRI